jgi:DNA ligase-1
MSLAPIFEILDTLSSMPGRLDKEATIDLHKDNELFRKVVNYTLNPFMMYNMTQCGYNPTPDRFQEYQNIDSIFKMLDHLAKKNGASNDEKEFLEAISSLDSETADVVNRIVSKDLKCGASVKTFRKFFPEIPIHEVMLCKDDPEEFLKRIGYNPQVCCYSVKKDGVRTWAVYDRQNDSVDYLSRNGKSFPNFSIFDDDVKELAGLFIKFWPEYEERYITFDGEVDAGGQDRFQKVMTQVRRLKQQDPKIFRFHIFDIVMNATFDLRYAYLHHIMSILKSERTFLLEHYSMPSWVTDVKTLIKLGNTHIEKGEEGIVVKIIKSVYEYKRSWFWLKLTAFKSMDVRVIGWEYGTGRNKNVVGRLICYYYTEEGEKIEFKVGSGFSDDERHAFMGDTPRIIEIEFRQFTKDKKPRFPVFIRPRDDK